MSPQWIDLAGTLNTRAIGALPVPGGQLRGGLLIRSDALPQLTAGDVRTLTEDWGVRTVLDLRSPLEVAEDGGSPLRDAGIDVRESPLIDGRNFTTLPEGLDRIGTDYGPLVRIGAKGIIDALEALATPGRLPAIVHCTAGKDRTGVVIAAVLDLLGVSRDIITEDYLATGERLAAIVERTRKLPSIRDNPVPPSAVQLSEEALRGAFGEFDAAGGTGEWLRANGAAADLPARLRAALVG